jgi:hypothetical protein
MRDVIATVRARALERGNGSTRTIAVIAAACSLGLAFVFVYANPFRHPDPSPLWTILLGVWGIALIVAVLDFPRLMLTVFAFSLPFGLYFGLSSPSMFALIGVGTIVYGVAAASLVSQARSKDAQP